MAGCPDRRRRRSARRARRASCTPTVITGWRGARRCPPGCGRPDPAGAVAEHLAGRHPGHVDGEPAERGGRRRLVEHDVVEVDRPAHRTRCRSSERASSRRSSTRALHAQVRPQQPLGQRPRRPPPGRPGPPRARGGSWRSGCGSSWVASETNRRVLVPARSPAGRAWRSSCSASRAISSRPAGSGTRRSSSALGDRRHLAPDGLDRSQRPPDDEPGGDGDERAAAGGADERGCRRPRPSPSTTGVGAAGARTDRTTAALARSSAVLGHDAEAVALAGAPRPTGPVDVVGGSGVDAAPRRRCVRLATTTAAVLRRRPARAPSSSSWGRASAGSPALQRRRRSLGPQVGVARRRWPSGRAAGAGRTRTRPPPAPAPTTTVAPSVVRTRTGAGRRGSRARHRRPPTGSRCPAPSRWWPRRRGRRSCGAGSAT